MKEESDRVLLTDEEGQEHKFSVVDIIEVNDNEYAILLPEDDEGDLDEDEAVILRVEQDENGDEVLAEIEDDEEWEMVADAWEDLLEEEDDDEDQEEDDPEGKVEV